MIKLPEWNYWVYKRYWEYIEDPILEGYGRDAADNDADIHDDEFSEIDYQKWARTSFWTPEQATFLSFGKDPDVREENEVSGLSRPSYFAVYFEHLYNMIERAQESGVLPSKISPAVYVEWSKRLDVDMPPDLVDEITKAEVSFRDISEQNKSLLAQVDDLKRELNLLRYQNDQLRGRSEAGSADTVSKPKIPSAETRRRQTLLKLVLSMAMRHYHYKIGATRQGATQKISDTAVLYGLPVDADTVRNCLLEASQAFRDEVSEPVKPNSV